MVHFGLGRSVQKLCAASQFLCADSNNAAYHSRKLQERISRGNSRFCPYVSLVHEKSSKSSISILEIYETTWMYVKTWSKWEISDLYAAFRSWYIKSFIFAKTHLCMHTAGLIKFQFLLLFSLQYHKIAPSAPLLKIFLHLWFTR